MSCIFCKIVAGEIPSVKVYEDDQVLAFKDLNPEAPEHVLLIPKKHIESLSFATNEDQTLLGYMQLKAAELAESLGLKEEGYRVVANTGKNGGQTVFHLHYHILGGRGMKWPPG